MRTYNITISDSNLKNFTGDVERGKLDKVCTTFGRGATNKFWEGKNVQISARFLTTFAFERK